jgi:hypothetical protein
MTSGHFRHLPVVGDAGLVGIVDITDVCRALLELDVSRLPCFEPRALRENSGSPARPETVAGRST